MTLDGEWYRGRVARPIRSGAQCKTCSNHIGTTRWIWDRKAGKWRTRVCDEGFGSLESGVTASGSGTSPTTRTPSNDLTMTSIFRTVDSVDSSRALVELVVDCKRKGMTPMSLARRNPPGRSAAATPCCTKLPEAMSTEVRPHPRSPLPCLSHSTRRRGGELTATERSLQRTAV